MVRLKPGTHRERTVIASFIMIYILVLSIYTKGLFGY